MTTISIIETAPVGGFQAGPQPLADAEAISLIDALFDAGIHHMEAAVFTGRSAAPPMHNPAVVLRGIRRGLDRLATAVTLTLTGANQAIAAGVDEIVLRLSISDSFSKAKANRAIVLSMDDAGPIALRAQQAGTPVRASLATVFRCPIEGAVNERRLHDTLEALQKLGVREISLHDTAGLATPPILSRTLRALRRMAPQANFTLRPSNDHGLALVNAMAALDEGVNSFEAAVAGLGAVRTEDLAYLMHALDLRTGIDLDALIAVARRVEKAVGLPASSRPPHAGPGPQPKRRAKTAAV
jgi:hydroxymethylglutaryl-CoA lyase